MSRKIFILSSLVLVAALILSACGGGGSSSGGGSTDVKVTAKEFSFDPANVTVPAGAKVNVTLTNTGSVDHTWVVMKAGTKVNGSFTQADQANILYSLKAAAGQTATGSFTAPAAGTYQIVCDIAGHFEAGMQGTLTVQ